LTVTEVVGLPDRLDTGRCLVMGVVNVTPDSFSDGGRWFAGDDAIAQGLWLTTQGADLIDVGGESTRPGATRIDESEELRRILPVVTELAAAGVAVSVDTMRAEVAQAALSAGAMLINDVSGGLADPDMAAVVGKAGVPYIAMHWRGHSDRMETLASYDDVVEEVVAELTKRLAALESAGVERRQVLLDPGLGFAKKAHHNWQLLANLDRLAAIGRPIVIGASRKRFLGTILAGPDGTPPPQARDQATTATSALAAAAGAWCVRVHEVRGSVDAVRVAAAWRQASAPGQPGQPGDRWRR
jgi:dihydropteroate synthase